MRSFKEWFDKLSKTKKVLLIIGISILLLSFLVAVLIILYAIFAMFLAASLFVSFFEMLRSWG